jgi:hypothetical protein
MSLSLKGGEVIAMINCKNNKKYDKKLMRINTDEELGQDEYEFPKECILQVLPSIKEVERLYISGPSGSGKSYFISKWLGANRKIFRNKHKKDIYIFSRIKYDQQLDKFNPIRVDLDTLIDEPYTGEMLADCIVIFDDIDSIADRLIKLSVYDLQTDLLTCGRHFNITVICTNHLIYNNIETKRVINESTSTVIFPKGGNIYQLKRFLQTYCGFEKHVIDKIMNLKSRWVCIRKTYPMCIIHEKGAFLPKHIS